MSDSKIPEGSVYWDADEVKDMSLLQSARSQSITANLSPTCSTPTRNCCFSDPRLRQRCQGAQEIV